MSDNTDKSQVDESTPDTTEVTDRGDQAGDETQEREMSLEDYKAALAAARKEAAANRVANKELKAKAAKFDELEESKKSELEKAQELIATLQAEKAEAVLAGLRSSIAATHGVPAELLTGDDEEALVASAVALKEWHEAAQSESHKGAPTVPSVGRDSGGADRDAIARQILGIG